MSTSLPTLNFLYKFQFTACLSLPDDFTSHSPLITSINNFNASAAKFTIFSARSADPVSTSRVNVPSGVETARARYPLLACQSLFFALYVITEGNKWPLLMPWQAWWRQGRETANLRSSVSGCPPSWPCGARLTDRIRAIQFPSNVLCHFRDDTEGWASVSSSVLICPSS